MKNTAQLQTQNEALFQACKKGDLNQIQIALDSGADINATGLTQYKGYTPLQYATLMCENNVVDVVKALLNVPNINVNARKFGTSPLHLAIVAFNDNAALTLIQDGRIDLNDKNELGQTVLDVVDKGDIKNALLKAGAKTANELKKEQERQEAEKKVKEQQEADKRRAEAAYRQTWQGYIHYGAKDLYSTACQYKWEIGVAATAIGVVVITSAVVIHTKPDIIFQNGIVSKVSDALFGAAEGLGR